MGVIPIVKTIGLGLGLLLWGSTSLVTGFFVGKFELFGVHKQPVFNEAMNWVGIWIVIAAMGVSFFIKPDTNKTKYQKIEDHQKTDINNSDDQETIFDRIPAKLKIPIGVTMAVGSGMLYGVNMVPMSLWVQDEQAKGNTPGPLDFVFSHFTGIYLYSTAVFVIYCIVNRRSGAPKVYPDAILPSMIGGVMWGVAQCGLMSATQILGWAIGFTMGSAGPLLVSSSWAVFYFREIRGARNLLLLGISCTLLIAGILLLGFSGVKHI